MISLAHSPVGSTVTISGHDRRFGEDYEVEAFLPSDLPDRIELPADTWMAITKAMTELGRLDAAAGLVPNPHLVTRIATRREAVGTSALEGTYANLTDVFAAEVLPLEQQITEVPPNVREVMNYTRAAEYAYQWIQDNQTSIGLLSTLQAELVKGTDSEGRESGRIRESQVFIGARNKRIRDARYVPPPPGDSLRAMLERWLRWLHDPNLVDRQQLLVRVAMAHYQFEAIHPFTDGNGRLGRLVAVLQILREGALRSPVLSISPWLKDHASEYRDHLLRVSETGEWSPWIHFFATAVTVQARDSHDRIMQLLDLRESLGNAVREALPRGRLAVEIVDDLIAFPIVSVASATLRHGRSNQANRSAINQLVEIGLLEPFSDRSYDRLYWNPRVFQIVED